MVQLKYTALSQAPPQAARTLYHKQQRPTTLVRLKLLLQCLATAWTTVIISNFKLKSKTKTYEHYTVCESTCAAVAKRYFTN